MTPEQLRQYINQLASSGREQSAAGNFGVGAKVAAGSRNPHGLEYRSWSGPGARWFASSATPTAAGGSSPSTGPTDAQTSGARSASRRSVAIARPGSRHPGRAASGASATTPSRPPTVSPTTPAMDHPLPQRPFCNSPHVLVRVHHGRGQPRQLQRNHGEDHHLQHRAIAAGAMYLSDAIAHWWVLDDDHRARWCEPRDLGLRRPRRRRLREGPYDTLPLVPTLRSTIAKPPRSAGSSGKWSRLLRRAGLLRRASI